ncbi:type II toxin-antitoxin system RelE/ParE family toxin [Xenorhabdus bovienii]|uniref:type II toxin-antitoxin system RelE/ParE family toxin n=1 Tax=Xenorhabdus bovienii TaxID=40576 RepID=UPI003DA47FD8
MHPASCDEIYVHGCLKSRTDCRTQGTLFLRVHKFQLNNQLTLLGYHWVEEKIELYLLNFGSHENFYQEQKRHRKDDLKFIK